MAKQESSTSSSLKSRKAFLKQLPKAKFWNILNIYKCEGFWFEHGLVKSGLDFRDSFEARNDDVLLASSIKTGTTWLKALCLTIMQNPTFEQDSEDILIKDSPHFQVQTIESRVHLTKRAPDLYSMPSVLKLFHTHLPYTLLPDSIKKSDCKIVYIARNPKDTLISIWHFFNKTIAPYFGSYPLEKAVESFCSGVQLYGPYHDHVLQYWLESQKRPDKILFLKYEELHKDPKGEVKKLASFLGRPFKNEEDVEKLLWRCSLERLKNLDVNKKGSVVHFVPNSSYFRRGVVGDSKNYLTPEMEKLIDETTRIKFEGSGLDFEL